MAAIENECIGEGIRFLNKKKAILQKLVFLMIRFQFGLQNDRTRYRFSGKRITRGLYQGKAGACIHADSNVAMDILKESGL